MTLWSDPVNFITQWLRSILSGWGVSVGSVDFWMNLLGAVILPTLAMVFCLFLIWYERKIIGRIQDRFGPNRIGPWGIFQPVADMLKIFTKEYITPIGADKLVYNLAPVLAVASVILIWAVIPFAKGTFGVDLNVGVLYVVAVGALGALAIIMAGWSSNNKYALLGAFRVVALLVSYEVPMVLALLVPVILARSMGMSSIIDAQGIWFIVGAPLAAFIFFISSMAEIGRSPFDLVEAESEIVAGFNIEYSGLKFGMFYVGEFLHAFTISLLFATLFLGGWRGPGAEQIPVLGFVYYFIKTMVVYFVVILFRGSLPRFRIDQMMDLNWKLFTPLSLMVVVLTAIVDKLLSGNTILVRSLGLFATNLVIGYLLILFLRRFARSERQRSGEIVNENVPA